MAWWDRPCRSRSKARSWTAARADPPLPGAAARRCGGDVRLLQRPSCYAWLAVPSELSEDRTSVTATVDHLSLWTDIVGGTADALDAVGSAFDAAGQAVTDAVEQGLQAVSQAGEWVAGWVYYAVGKIFDTRVDAPTCTDPLPTWVESTQQIALDKNNPILWCAGRDRLHPELLTVKARVNRGFGFPVHDGCPATVAAQHHLRPDLRSWPSTHWWTRSSSTRPRPACRGSARRPSAAAGEARASARGRCARSTSGSHS